MLTACSQRALSANVTKSSSGAGLIDGRLQTTVVSAAVFAGAAARLVVAAPAANGFALSSNRRAGPATGRTVARRTLVGSRVPCGRAGPAYYCPRRPALADRG